MTAESSTEPKKDQRRLFIMDDDAPLRRRMAAAMRKRGFRVEVAESLEEGLFIIRHFTPDYALIDLRLSDGSGLDFIETLREMHPDCHIVMLTAYGNLATAVASVKAGAVDYLCKPADADQVEVALLNHEQSILPPVPEHPMPADRVKWEHIQRVYEQCGRNISETARQLKMHRRSLQRIMQKYAPKDKGPKDKG